MNTRMLKTELYKIYSKKVIWIAMFLFLALFLIIRLQFIDNIQVKYNLEPLRHELTKAVSNEELHKFICDNNYNVSLEEMAVFLPISVFDYIEEYRDSDEIYRSLSGNLRNTILNYYERIDNRAKFIADLSKEGSSSEGGALAKAKEILLSDYQNSKVEIELNLNSSANNLIDVNHAMAFPCFIMLVVLLGLSGIYSDEYTSNTQAVLLTAKKGRMGVFLSKLLAAIIFVVSVVLIMETFFIVATAICYHAPKSTISAASTYGLSLTTYSGSIFSFCIRQVMGTLLACFTMGCIIMAISVHSKNSLIPFLVAGIYYGSTALYANMIAFPSYLSRCWSLPGELSPFMLQTQVELVAVGHYTNMFGIIIPTLTVNVLFQVVLAFAALVFCCKGYIRKQVKN